MRFGVYADNGPVFDFAQVNAAVFGVNPLRRRCRLSSRRRISFHSLKNGVDIDVGSKFDFILGYGVGGYPGLSSLTFLPLLAREGKEQGYAYKGVASVVGFWDRLHRRCLLHR